MENKISYTLGAGFSGHTDDNNHTTGEYLNIPRDLACINRKNVDMVSREGVPLNYHCRFTILRNPQDDTDISTTVSFLGAQSNWVTRNASVKLHHAREKMFSNAGIRKSERGRYDKTLRLNFDARSQTWVVPTLGDGSSVFTDLGEWDASKVAIDDDPELVPCLFGPVLSEESAVSGDTFNIQNAYLNSRRALETDDQVDADSSAPHSILRSMVNIEDAVDDELQVIAQDNQDQTPYDAEAVAGTFTSVTILGITQVGNLAQSMTTVDVTIPFGICSVAITKQTADDDGGDMSGGIPILCEVLGVSEMQG